MDDEAKEVLVNYQNEHKLSTRDEALERVLHEFKIAQKKKK